MKIIKLFMQYVNKSQISIFLVIVLVSWIITMYLPLANANFVDYLVNVPINNYIYYILLTIFVLSITNIVLTYVTNIMKVKISIDSNFKITFKILEHIRKLPLTFFYNKNAGYLSQRINLDVTSITEFVLGDIINLIFNVLTFLTSILLLWTINKNISLILFILIPIYILIYNLFKKNLYTSNFKSKEAQNLYFGEINNLLKNITFFKLHSINDIFDKYLTKKYKETYQASTNAAKVSNSFTGLGILISASANIFILLFAINQINDHKLTIGEFTIISTYFNNIMSSVKSFQNITTNFHKALVSYNRIEELLKLKEIKNGTTKIKHIESISIEKLTFGYDDELLLKNINVELKKGFIYRILGENGDGKSTLLNIIAGMYNGTYKGTIKFSQNDILDLDMHDVRKNLIGIVEQEPNLFNDTIINNITYNLNDYDSFKLDYLIKKLNLSTLVDKLENGLNSTIQDISSNISGGEKQKISLIRALIKNPDVIILDESNSALDRKSKLNLSYLLEEEKKDKIIVLISHSDELNSIVDFNIPLK